MCVCVCTYLLNVIAIIYADNKTRERESGVSQKGERIE